MPHRGVSCHLFDDDVPSFVKNLLQKAEPPPGWCEEVLRLLRDSGYLDDTLRSWGLTEADIAAVYASIEETPTDALTP
jgi:hypothetical protein